MLAKTDYLETFLSDNGEHITYSSHYSESSNGYTDYLVDKDADGYAEHRVTVKSQHNFHTGQGKCRTNVDNDVDGIYDTKEY